MKRTEKDFEKKVYDEFGLDWDNISMKEAEKKFKTFLIDFDFEKVEMRQSSSKKGIHIRVKLKNKISIREYLIYRLHFDDDFMRVVLDAERYCRGEIFDLLWDYKYKMDWKIKKMKKFTSGKWHNIY